MPLFRKLMSVSCLLVFLLMTFYVSSCTRTESQGSLSEGSDTSAIRQSRGNFLYGIETDSFEIIRGRVRQNRFLSEILEEYRVSVAEIDQAVRNSPGVFDVKDIRAGHDYIVLTGMDSLKKARYFIYSHEAYMYYIFSFNDSVNISEYRNEIRSQIRFSSVRIETSLWEAMIGKGIDPEIASELSEIYAWTVDFFGLQKGDCFKVIYEEKFIEGKPAGTGGIFAACYYTANDTIYAIPLIQEGKESFFSFDGKSLRREFLKAPLRFSRISSRFSSGRLHPVLRIVRPHFGVDYAAPEGTPVYTVGDGKVISVSSDGESGRMIKIRHNSVYTTAYLHLNSFARGVFPGANLKQGDLIGYVGNSGLSTGPHLDFRFYRNGYAVDPLRIDAPASVPVMEENKSKFERIARVVVSLLESFN